MLEVQQSISGFSNMCTLKIADPTAVRGVGFHELQFGANLSFPGTDTDNVRVNAIEIAVTLAGAPVGHCQRSGAGLPYSLSSTGGSYYFTALLDLTHCQLTAMEDARAGGDLNLQMVAQFQFFGLRGYAADTSIWVSFSGINTIPQSVWINQVLKKLAFQDYLLLEVPLSTQPQDASLERAVGHLQKARDLASKGEYLHAVAECRPAMDEIERAYGLKPADRAILAAYAAGDQKKAQHLDKASRFAVWRYGLVGVIHAAHHKEEGHDPWEWGRAGAMAVITATAAMIEASYSPEARETAGPKAVLATVKASKQTRQPKQGNAPVATD